MRLSTTVRTGAVAWLLSALVTGCAAQLSGGYQAPDTQRDRPVIMAFGTRLVQTRANGPYLSSDVVCTLPPLADDRFRVRRVQIGGGYRWLLYPLSLELGSNLGAGQPAYRLWDRTGVYLGMTGSVLYRIAGDHDDQPGYAPAGVLWDAVVDFGAGVWSRTATEDQSSTTGDYSVRVGLRLTLVSDIAVPSDQGWVPP